MRAFSHEGHTHKHTHTHTLRARAGNVGFEVGRLSVYFGRILAPTCTLALRVSLLLIFALDCLRNSPALPVGPLRKETWLMLALG